VRLPAAALRPVQREPTEPCGGVHQPRPRQAARHRLRTRHIQGDVHQVGIGNFFELKKFLVSVHGPSRLCFDPLKLVNFDFSVGFLMFNISIFALKDADAIECYEHRELRPLAGAVTPLHPLRQSPQHPALRC
jgi:hypothetical protein